MHPIFETFKHFQIRWVPGLDDPRVDGGPVPGRGLRPARLLPRQPRLHRPARQDQVRLPHHHGGGKEVTTRVINPAAFLCPCFSPLGSVCLSWAINLTTFADGEKACFVLVLV